MRSPTTSTYLFSMTVFCEISYELMNDFMSSSSLLNNITAAFVPVVMPSISERAALTHWATVVQVDRLTNKPLRSSSLARSLPPDLEIVLS